MRMRIAAVRAGALLGCGLAIGGGTLALAQDPGSEIGITVPSGSIVAFGGTDAPAGWLIADGSEVSRTAYPALFAAIGTRYGAGNGSTTFNLPDLRGRITVGRGTNANVDTVGESDAAPLAQRQVKHNHGKGTLTTNTTGNHQHGVSVHANDVGKAHQDYYGAEGTDGWTGIGTYWTSAAGSHNHTITGQVGDTTGPTDGPAYMTVNYLIKS